MDILQRTHMSEKYSAQDERTMFVDDAKLTYPDLNFKTMNNGLRKTKCESIKESKNKYATKIPYSARKALTVQVSSCAHDILELQGRFAGDYGMCCCII